MVDPVLKRDLAIRQIRHAASNLYEVAENSGVESPEWKAARVLNSLSNALDFGVGLYQNQLAGFVDDFRETEA